MNAEFDGKVVVVTGATGELGFAVVERLYRAGATFRLPVRRLDKAGRLRELDPSRVSLVPGVDLTDAASVKAFYAELPSLWASIHCAGGFAAAPLAQTTLEDFGKMLSINAVSCFLCCGEALRRLCANPAAPEGVGRIVNVTAMTAVDPPRGAGLSAYAASKAVIASLTRTAAVEVAARGLWVNAIAPSILDTPVNRQALPQADFASWPKLEQAAEAIAFLASPGNRAVTGAIVPVTGRG